MFSSLFRRGTTWHYAPDNLLSRHAVDIVLDATTTPMSKLQLVISHAVEETLVDIVLRGRKTIRVAENSPVLQFAHHEVFIGWMHDQEVGSGILLVGLAE